MLESIRDYSNPDSLGARMRRRRFVLIENMVRRILAEQADCKILDVGGTVGYWNLMDADLLRQCSVWISNLEAPRGSDPRANQPAVGEFHFHTGNALHLDDIADQQFDLAHSNSVIEHVGSIADMQRFASEMRRVGRHYYIQTPNLWFPVEPHYGVPFIHWLPVASRAWLLTRFNVGFHRKYESLFEAYNYIEFVNLIDRRTLQTLFPDGEMHRERVTLLTKSLMVCGSA